MVANIKPVSRRSKYRYVNTRNIADFVQDFFSHDFVLAALAKAT
ncbi:MAG: hypothetical protein AABY09_00900 [Nanoarchaeota archaeon]